MFRETRYRAKQLPGCQKSLRSTQGSRRSENQTLGKQTRHCIVDKAGRTSIYADNQNKKNAKKFSNVFLCTMRTSSPVIHGPFGPECSPGTGWPLGLPRYLILRTIRSKYTTRILPHCSLLNFCIGSLYAREVGPNCEVDKEENREK